MASATNTRTAENNKPKHPPYYCTWEMARTLSRDTLLRHAKAQLMEALPHFHPAVIRQTVEDLLAGKILPCDPTACLLATLSTHQWCVGITECSGYQGVHVHRRCIEKGERTLGYDFTGQTWLEHYLFTHRNTCGTLLPQEYPTRTVARWMGQYLSAVEQEEEVSA